jgi:hypothetical protein
MIETALGDRLPVALGWYGTRPSALSSLLLGQGTARAIVAALNANYFAAYPGKQLVEADMLHKRRTFAVLNNG